MNRSEFIRSFLMLPFIKLIAEHKPVPGITPTPIPSVRVTHCVDHDPLYPSEMYNYEFKPTDIPWTMPPTPPRVDVITSQRLPKTAKIDTSVGVPTTFIVSGKNLYFTDFPNGTWVGPGYWFYKVNGFLNLRGTWGDKNGKGLFVSI